MGILDNKTRILDTLLTQEGRRQIAQGKLRIKYVTFTDAETFYDADIVSGTSDPADRIYLEAANLPQDQITFSSDDSGRLSQYKGSTLGVIDGKVLSGSSASFLTVVTGSEFISISEDLLDASIDNFSKLYAIRTNDSFNDTDREFATSTNSITFNVTDRSPFGKKEVTEISVEHVEGVFQDKRLSHLPDFRYLPPVNKETTPGSGTSPLGNFPAIGQRRTPMSYDDIVRDLSTKDVRTIDFSSTTISSNVVCQMFELKQDILHKLHAIDFGQVHTDDPVFPLKRVFFIGKVFIDTNGIETFVNMFTIIFE